jgi:threonine/homoserine/homoserine lactone efflux protein
MPLFDLMPALLFLMLNVFIPGPNVLNTIATAMGSGLRLAWRALLPVVPGCCCGRLPCC